MADGTITVEVSTQAAQEELARLRAQNEALKRDLQYARDGLTKGRTRMREDIERLTAENAALKRKAHEWWTACAHATKEIEWLTQDNRKLRADMRAVLSSSVGRQTLAQLADGQGSATVEGRAWLDAAALVLGPNVEVTGA